MRAVEPPLSEAVDVAIVMYGGAEHLSACLDALAAQTAVIGRVWVIDNATPGGIGTAAHDALDVVVVTNDTNLGYAAAMNQAHALSSAPFLLSLNADCALDTGYVAACLAALGQAPRAAACTGVLRLPDGRIDSTGIALLPNGTAADRDRHRDDPSSDEPFGVSGAAALWRRAALADLGPEPWWSWLFVYWDDVEIAFRLRARGWTFLCAPDAHATHRRGSDSADPDFVEGMSLRNRIATLGRHRGLRGLLTPTVAPQLALTVARLAVRHPRALRRAEPVRALRAALAQRRADAFAA